MENLTPRIERSGITYRSRVSKLRTITTKTMAANKQKDEEEQEEKEEAEEE